MQKAYGGQRKVAWFEVFAGETAKNKFDNWLPDDTVEAFKEFLVGIKGLLTTPVGGGIRSLNVALRQMLDLYVCLRPVQYFQGVPSPVKHPEKVEMVIFRENTEDIYAGIEYAEWNAGSAKDFGFSGEGIFRRSLQEDPLRHEKSRQKWLKAIWKRSASPDHDPAMVPRQMWVSGSSRSVILGTHSAGPCGDRVCDRETSGRA